MKSFTTESYGDRVCRSILEEIFSEERREWSTQKFRASVVTYAMVKQCNKNRSVSDWISIALRHIKQRDLTS
jgi:hypothetical protein